MMRARSVSSASRIGMRAVISRSEARLVESASFSVAWASLRRASFSAKAAL